MNEVLEHNSDECEKYNCTNPWDENGDVDQRHLLIQIYFWLDGVFQSSISVVGILGNVFTILIFSTKYLRSTFHTYLIMLAVFDLGYISVATFEEILQLNDIMEYGTTYPPDHQLCQIF